MALHSLHKRGEGRTGKASYALTIPKGDLEADGHLELLEALDGGIPCLVTRTGPGRFTVELRPDLLPEQYDDLLDQLDLPTDSDDAGDEGDSCSTDGRQEAPARAG